MSVNSSGSSNSGDNTWAPVAIVLGVIVVALLLGYFLWYAPSQNVVATTPTDVHINVTNPNPAPTAPSNPVIVPGPAGAPGRDGAPGAAGQPGAPGAAGQPGAPANSGSTDAKPKEGGDSTPKESTDSTPKGESK